MKYYSLLIMTWLLLFFSGCQPSPQPGDKFYNVGKWSHINEYYMESVQFENDKAYCNGRSNQISIPAYTPVNVVQPAQTYEINANVNSYNYQTGSYSNSYVTGTATPRNSFGNSFAQGFANGAAIAANAERNAAIARRNNTWKTCMKSFAWEQATETSIEFEDFFYAYSSLYNEKIDSIIWKKEFISNFRPDRNKIKSFMNSDIHGMKKLKEGMQKFLAYVEKNEDVEFTAKALKTLSKIYMDGIIVEKDLNKSIRMLEKAANLGYIDAEFALANLLYKGDSVSYLEGKYNDLIDKNKSMYYYKKVANRYIPKKQVEYMENKIAHAESIFYKDIIEARYILGVEYIKGKLLEPNSELGFEYIYNSAILGYKIAQLELSAKFFEKKEKKKGLYWLDTFLNNDGYEGLIEKLILKTEDEYYEIFAKFVLLEQEINLLPKAKEFLANYKIKNAALRLSLGNCNYSGKKINISGVISFEEFPFLNNKTKQSTSTYKLPVFTVDENVCLGNLKEQKPFKKNINKFILGLTSKKNWKNYVNGKFVDFDIGRITSYAYILYPTKENLQSFEQKKILLKNAIVDTGDESNIIELKNGEYISSKVFTTVYDEYGLITIKDLDQILE